MKITIICSKCDCQFEIKDVPKIETTYECPNCNHKIIVRVPSNGGTMTRGIKELITQTVEQWIDDYNEEEHKNNDGKFIVLNAAKEDLIKRVVRAITPGIGISGY